MIQPRYPIGSLYAKTYPEGGPQLKALKAKAKRLLGCSRFLTVGEWEWVLACDEGVKSGTPEAPSRPKRMARSSESATKKAYELNQRLKQGNVPTNSKPTTAERLMTLHDETMQLLSPKRH